MKNNLNLLLKKLLNEAQPPIRPKSMADFAPTEKKDLSLDKMVDRYLVQYEKASIPINDVFESANTKTLTKYLFEQDDLDLSGLGGDPQASPATGDATDMPDLGIGDEPPEANNEQQPVMDTPQINLQDFARAVARLVGNFNSLVDVKSILLNRANEYIKNNYDERTSKELTEILETDYDLMPSDTSSSSYEEDDTPNPRAGITGPVGG